MPSEDREREFSRRELLRAGWAVPAVLALGGLATACGGGGEQHADLEADLLKEVRGKARRSSPSTTSPSTTTSTTTTTSPSGSTAPSTPSGGTTRRGGGGVHTDVPHVDSAHGDVAAGSVPHTDEHGDAPETTHDDILAYERGESDRYVTIPHVDTPHSDVPHTDQAHVDAPHADSPHADA